MPEKREESDAPNVDLQRRLSESTQGAGSLFCLGDRCSLDSTADVELLLSRCRAIYLLRLCLSPSLTWWAGDLPTDPMAGVRDPLVFGLHLHIVYTASCCMVYGTHPVAGEM